MDRLKSHFRPEFLNRLDEIIMFKPLSKDAIGNIVDLLVNELNERVVDKGICIKLSKTAKDYIIEEGYDPIYGARPLRRFIQKNVETLVARAILSNELCSGDTILLDYSNGLCMKNCSFSQ